mgnify:CR=1 FL=1
MALVSMACAYASSLAGFVSGVASGLLATVQLGGGMLRQGELHTGALDGPRFLEMLDGIAMQQRIQTVCALCRLVARRCPILASCPHQPLHDAAGTLAAHKLACIALHGAAQLNRVAAPVMLGLLRTLALSRLFA